MYKIEHKKQIIKLTVIPFISALFLCSTLAPKNAIARDTSDIIKYSADDKKNKKNKKKFTHFTSGTGFFVSDNYIVTNEHVVQNCKAVKIRGAVEPGFATIHAIDRVNDLALLKTSQNPVRIAKLRGAEIPLSMGETVTVMGYPLEYGIKGQYLIKTAKITDPNDVYDGVSRIQFTDSVEKGNSGGPLLDSNGNVIGVVVGKMSFYLADATTQNGIEAKPVKTSSMAINLDSLRGFLKTNGVYYKEDHSQYNYPDQWMEQKAKKYIVNVHCVKD